MQQLLDGDKCAVIFNTDDGLFATFSSVDDRPGVTQGTERFNTPGERKAAVASFLGSEFAY